MSAKKKRQTRQTAENSQKYDSAWKDVVEELFEPFLEFFFPEVHADIDFSKGYEFLSKELRKIIPYSKVGKRYADELVKVHLKDGSVKCIRIFIHVEIQGQPEANFEERVFIYHLSEEVIKIEEEHKMPYVTSWERIAEKKGEKKVKLQTARELVKRGVDINIIAESTGLSREEIEKLATEVQ